MPDRRLDGRLALVTGAASGIGRSTARRLAADGAVVGCLDRAADGLRAVAAAIETASGRASILVADVTDRAGVATAVAGLVEEYGPVSILVNNAGVPGTRQFLDVSYEDWRQVLDVHVDGAFHLTKAVLPGMVVPDGAGSSTSRRRRSGSATRACST